MTNGDGQQAMAVEIRELKGARSAQPQYNPPFDSNGIYQIMMRFAAAGATMPPWGSPNRDVELRKFFYAEGNDLLQGAASSLVKKMKAIPWTISGPDRQVRRLQQTLTLDADMGKGIYHKMEADSVMRIVDMPSTTEGGAASNIGFCALSRVVKSARVMQMFATYKEEKLDSRPAPGIAVARGLATQELT